MSSGHRSDRAIFKPVFPARWETSEELSTNSASTAFTHLKNGIRSKIVTRMREDSLQKLLSTGDIKNVSFPPSARVSFLHFVVMMVVTYT